MIVYAVISSGVEGIGWILVFLFILLLITKIKPPRGGTNGGY